MEIEQVAEMARAVAALPQAERDFFDGVLTDAKAAAAEEERIAELRTMSDLDAVQFAIKQAADTWALDGLPERLLQALRDAGFVREPAPPQAPSTVGQLLQKANEDLLGRIWKTFNIRVLKEAHGPGLVVSVREKEIWGNSYHFTRNRTSGEILAPVEPDDDAPDGLSFLLNEAVEKVAQRFEARPA